MMMKRNTSQWNLVVQDMLSVERGEITPEVKRGWDKVS